MIPPDCREGRCGTGPESAPAEPCRADIRPPRTLPTARSEPAGSTHPSVENRCQIKVVRFRMRERGRWISPSEPLRTKAVRFMKLPLMIAALAALCCGCKKSSEKSSGQSAIAYANYTGPNTLMGHGRIGDTGYHCTLNPSKVRESGGWSFGSGEPPIGPGKAMSIAIEALKRQFPEIDHFSSDVISLIRYKEGAVYQAVFTSGPDRGIGERSNMENYMYIFVYLDGTVEAPTPASPERESPGQQ